MVRKTTELGVRISAEGTEKTVSNIKRVGHVVEETSRKFAAGANSSKNLAITSDNTSRSLDKTANSSKNLAITSDKTSRSLDRKSNANRSLASSSNNTSQNINKTANSMDKLGAKADQTGKKLSRLRTHIVQTGKSTNRMSGNLGMVTAQFQDIGVTAAMGMSPMMIAMQQGTQLAGIFQMQGLSLTGTLKSLAGGFAALFSPVSLFAIGITGLTAAMIAATNWTKVWHSIVGGVRGTLRFMKRHVEEVTYAVMALSLAGSRALIPMFVRLGGVVLRGMVANLAVYTTALRTTAGVMGVLRTINPFSSYIKAITFAIGSMYLFRDSLNTVFSHIKGFTGGIVDLGGAFDYMSDKVKSGISQTQRALGFQEDAFADVGDQLKDIGKISEESMTNLNVGFDTLSLTALDASKSIQGYFSGAFNNLTRALTKFILYGENKFGELKTYVLESMTEMAIKAATSKLFQLIGTFTAPAVTGVWSFLKSIFGFARGGLTNQVPKFASGGIINQPVAFGIAGEAGPEAIMPVKRMPSGNFGVEATQAPGNITINVSNMGSPITVSSVAERYENNKRIIDVVVSDLKVNGHITQTLRNQNFIRR